MRHPIPLPPGHQRRCPRDVAPAPRIVAHAAIAPSHGCVYPPPADAAAASGVGLASMRSGFLAALAASGVWAAYRVAA